MTSLHRYRIKKQDKCGLWFQTRDYNLNRAKSVYNKGFFARIYFDVVGVIV